MPQTRLRRHKAKPYQAARTTSPGFFSFLSTKAFLTIDEGEFSQKLYNYLSNAGSHSLGGAPEHKEHRD
jgi:hypothetical protein